MTATLAPTEDPLTAPDNVTVARRVRAMHFHSKTYPNMCFRCGEHYPCKSARWAAGILALAGEPIET